MWFCRPERITPPDTLREVPVEKTDAAVNRAWEGEAMPQADVVPLTAGMLRAGMDALAAGILPWDCHRFRRVKKLQQAERNHGCVELMRDGGNFVAVKKMPTRWICGSPDEFDAQHPKADERPWMDVGIVRLLNEVRYPYCVKLLDIFADDKSTYVVSSLASEGDLFAWCECASKPGLHREAAMYPLVNQIFTGVRWLHDFGVAHRDLSLENILLHSENGDLRVQIIDFSMSTLDQSASAEVRGKPSYQAPEIHLPQPFDTEMTDSFSLGVVMFAMGAEDYPWKTTKRKACELFEYACMFGFSRLLSKRRLRKGGGESLAEVFSPSFTALLAGLLAKDAGNGSLWVRDVLRRPRMAAIGGTAYGIASGCSSLRSRRRRSEPWPLCHAEQRARCAPDFRNARLTGTDHMNPGKFSCCNRWASSLKPIVRYHQTILLAGGNVASSLALPSPPTELLLLITLSFPGDSGGLVGSQSWALYRVAAVVKSHQHQSSV
ncbi:unnamed protein product [Prorocentrum cordatum]|uniref:Protein kinase domain-containing protein n=1 Tax=Prorocentrum cordatum TaxID=2364126 RepID=A0ABN9XNI4_9DINO|nr:unnamed protein product [Polarella glacialis]